MTVFGDDEPCYEPSGHRHRDGYVWVCRACLRERKRIHV